MSNMYNYFYYNHHRHHRYCYYNKPCCNNRTRAFVLCFFFFFFLCGFTFFCAFNVSLCDVISDVRFLFFFSNTIILVIVADYGAFVSEEKYGKVAVEDPVLCSVVVKVEGYEASGGSVGELTAMGADSPKEEENVVEDDITVPGGSEEEVGLLTCNDVGSCDVDGNGDGEGQGEENDDLSWMVNETDIDEDEEGSVMGEEEEEDDEFSRMSDEELNKRVEEFIYKLRKQIQQQAVRDAE